MELKREVTEESLQRLVDSIHGSGLDCDATITDHKEKFKIAWAYHVMNDTGYYVGWVEFVVWVPKTNPADFRLAFRHYSQYKAKRYQLRDYLEDTFAEAIQQAFYR